MKYLLNEICAQDSCLASTGKKTYNLVQFCTIQCFRSKINCRSSNEVSFKDFNKNLSRKKREIDHELWVATKLVDFVNFCPSKHYRRYRLWKSLVITQFAFRPTLKRVGLTPACISRLANSVNLLVRRRFEIRFKLASFVVTFFILVVGKDRVCELRHRNYLTVRPPDDGQIWSAVGMITDRETRSTAIKTCTSVILSAINSTWSGLRLNTAFHRDNSATTNMNLRHDSPGKFSGQTWYAITSSRWSGWPYYT